MAESGGLENRWAFTRPVGSNPTPSALSHRFHAWHWKLVVLSSITHSSSIAGNDGLEFTQLGAESTAGALKPVDSRSCAYM